MRVCAHAILCRGSSTLLNGPACCVGRLRKGGQPTKISWEARAIKKGTDLGRKCILGGTVGPGRLQDVPKVIQHSVPEHVTPSKFTALVSADDSITLVKFFMNVWRIWSGGSLDIVRNAQAQCNTPSTMIHCSNCMRE